MAFTTFPETIDHPAIADAVDQYQRRARELAEARHARVELEQTREQCVEADTQAAADAIEAGKPNPGTRRADKRDKEIAQALNQERALDVVTARSLELLIGTVDKHADEWATTLQRREARAREAFVAAIEALTDAHAALADAMATQAWLAGFPDHAGYMPMRFASRLRGIPSANGDPVHVAVVVAALRELADPPPELEPVRHAVRPGVPAPLAEVA